MSFPIIAQASETFYYSGKNNPNSKAAVSAMTPNVFTFKGPTLTEQIEQTYNNQPKMAECANEMFNSLYPTLMNKTFDYGVLISTNKKLLEKKNFKCSNGMQLSIVPVGFKSNLDQTSKMLNISKDAIVNHLNCPLIKDANAQILELFVAGALFVIAAGEFTLAGTLLFVTADNMSGGALTDSISSYYGDLSEWVECCYSGECNCTPMD